MSHTTLFRVYHPIKVYSQVHADLLRLSNSEPIPGQADWFDLNVKIDASDPNDPAVASPQFPALPRMNAVDTEPVNTLRYGLQRTVKDKKAWVRKQK